MIPLQAIGPWGRQSCSQGTANSRSLKADHEQHVRGVCCTAKYTCMPVNKLEVDFACTWTVAVTGWVTLMYA